MSSTSSKYDIRLMHKNDYEQVLSLLTKSFFHEEPITRYLQITDTSEFSENVIDTCLQNHCSFVAYDKETNQIIAVCLNDIVNKNDKNGFMTSNEKLNFIMQILDDLHKEVNIFDQLNANTLLHIFMITVDKIARGHGLASSLILKSVERAKELKLRGAYAEATSVYSFNCFKKQQFKLFHELIYTDYDSKRLANLNNPMYDRCYLVGTNF